MLSASKSSQAHAAALRRIQPGCKPAVLAVQAYDVEKNQDIFFKEVQDGVNAIAIGKMGPAGTTLVIVGGELAGSTHTRLPWLELEHGSHDSGLTEAQRVAGRGL